MEVSYFCTSLSCALSQEFDAVNATGSANRAAPTPASEDP